MGKVGRSVKPTEFFANTPRDIEIEKTWKKHTISVWYSLVPIFLLEQKHRVTQLLPKREGILHCNNTVLCTFNLS